MSGAFQCLPTLSDAFRLFSNFVQRFGVPFGSAASGRRSSSESDYRAFVWNSKGFGSLRTFSGTHVRPFSLCRPYRSRSSTWLSARIKDLDHPVIRCDSFLFSKFQTETTLSNSDSFYFLTGWRRRFSGALSLNFLQEKLF